MPTDPHKPRMMDWLARLIAWGTIKAPRVAPSYWWQDANHRRANDMPSEAFRVTADDGVKLDAWYFPPQSGGTDKRSPRSLSVMDVQGHSPLTTPQTALSVPPEPGLPIFFSHGWTETKEFHIRLARVLTAAGHPVVLFDQRGHGRSGGGCTLGVREPGDLRAVIDEAAKRGWVGEHVLTMGVSMGGASVLRHAASDKRVQAVVSYAPYTSFLDAIRSYRRRYVPWFSAEWGVRGFVQCCARRGFDIEQASAMDAIGKIEVPILLIVGTADINLPASDHASILLSAARPGVARLIEVSGANHFNICMSRWPGVDEEVLAFFERID